MTNKQIKHLANLSYTKDELDETKVRKILSNLSRKELKYYIKSIKDLEKRNNVFVYLPENLKDKEIEKMIKNKFPTKKILFKEDKTLIAGIKIVDYDNIYDLSLLNNLGNIVSFIK